MSDLKIFTDNIEWEAKEQIYTLLRQPAFSKSKVRIMPDVHAGVGCVIGFTADLGDKVVPNIVGVDIGCGMKTVSLGSVDIDFEKLDAVIREKIPAGRTVNDSAVCPFDLTAIRCYRSLKKTDWIARSIGTLGGGNHFIEVDVDNDGNKYLIIHTGSRNLGKQVAEHYQNIAIRRIHGKGRNENAVRELVEEYKAAGLEKEIPDAIKELKTEGLGIPKDLCYLEGEDRLDYLHDMALCQTFAMLNRQVIADRICEAMGWRPEDDFETVHNYIDHGSNIVRKGAISARLGERVLIPMNMRDGCIIGIGRGNEDWNCSAPHGAGRIMSRKKAKEVVSLDEYVGSMQGIFTTSVSRDTIDESPMVYKPAEEIIECIKDTVDIVKIIKPVYNFKASE